MFHHVFSATLSGIRAEPVRVETSASFGLTQCSVIGLPDAEVREAKDRIRGAFKTSSLAFPRGRLTISLSPAIVRKQGSHFDLAIAVSLLITEGLLPVESVSDAFFFGELALNGDVLPIRGMLPFALCAKERGARRLYLPKENLGEAHLVEGLELVAVPNFLALLAHLRNEGLLQAERARGIPEKKTFTGATDFAFVRGQEMVKRALEIAGAGAHNVLLCGSPGTGKTLLARALPSILPPLTTEEVLEVTQIHSIAGALCAKDPIVVQRPFRSPHHSSSAISIIGGGSIPKPGEVSLAHRGVLFLDELPEFTRHVLEHLRQPIEDGEVTISRAMGTERFPARFMLVAAMNPCPCGYAGDPLTVCECSPRRILEYNKKISGPLLDRIDLCIRVPRVEHAKLLSEETAEPSEVIRSRVLAARLIQHKRCREHGFLTNSEIPPSLLRRLVVLGEKERGILETALRKLHLSARAFSRVLKVARTIADLAGEEQVRDVHLLEALQYRDLGDTHR